MCLEIEKKQKKSKSESQQVINISVIFSLFK